MMSVSCICVWDHFVALFIHIVGASQLALVVKNLSANAGDRRGAGSVSGSGRSPGGGHKNPLQCSCLEHLMDRGAWGLQSMGSQRVGHDWSNLTHIHIVGKTMEFLYPSSCTNKKVNNSQRRASITKHFHPTCILACVFLHCALFFVTLPESYK